MTRLGRSLRPNRSRNLRRLTVLNRYRGGESAVPDIRLSGKWLAEAGFAPGCRVAISIERQGQLVVTITAPPGPLRRRVPEERTPW
jgi:hypothetical protein